MSDMTLETTPKPIVLENRLRRKTSFKIVISRGKRYVYLRATNASVVKGFIGSDSALDDILGKVAGLNPHYRRAVSSRESWRVDAAKLLYKCTRARAGHTKRSHTLSVETIVQMLRKARDRCQVTGMQFDYYPQKQKIWKSRPMAPSLDRLDNKAGYDPGNVRLVCNCVNVAINEWGLENFAAVCRAFVANGKPTIADPL